MFLDIRFQPFQGPMLDEENTSPRCPPIDWSPLASAPQTAFPDTRRIALKSSGRERRKGERRRLLSAAALTTLSLPTLMNFMLTRSCFLTIPH